MCNIFFFRSPFINCIFMNFEKHLFFFFYIKNNFDFVIWFFKKTYEIFYFFYLDLIFFSFHVELIYIDIHKFFDIKLKLTRSLKYWGFRINFNFNFFSNYYFFNTQSLWFVINHNLNARNLSSTNQSIWNNIPWKFIQFKLYFVQKRIYKANLIGNKRLIIYLQNLVIHSLEARYLSIRCICLDKSSNFWLSFKEKIYMAQTLELNEFSFLKRIHRISTFDMHKTISFNIPKTREMAKQLLILMTFETEWEFRFESHSYGFRPQVYTYNVINAIYYCLSIRDKRRIFFKVYTLELKLIHSKNSFYYFIFFLKFKLISIFKLQINEWFYCSSFHNQSYEHGFFKNKLCPSYGLLYFFLLNIVLYGIESLLNKWIIDQIWSNNKQRYRIDSLIKKKTIKCMNFMNEFFIIHENVDVLIYVTCLMLKWLKKRTGLYVLKSKLKIIESTSGFSFLGFRFLHINKKNAMWLKIYPTFLNQKELLLCIRNFCKSNRTISIFQLIESIKFKLFSWGNYFCYLQCKYIFNYLDYKIYQIIRLWIFWKKCRFEKSNLKEIYFPTGIIYIFLNNIYKTRLILYKVLDKKGEIWLPKMSWFISQ